jgi:hypothetical protein
MNSRFGALRHEYKYLVSRADYLSIRTGLSAALKRDKHMTDEEGYFVRSLYFDDPALSGFVDKVNGNVPRSKTRIRFYNYDDSFIRLEKKHKDAYYISKSHAPLTPVQVDRILQNDISFLLRSKYEQHHAFYADYRLKRFKPVVIVDYQREAYTMREGNVRVTFDKDLQSAYADFSDESFDIFSRRGFRIRNIYPPQMMTMEVKYDEFLPDVVKRLVRPYRARRVELSKYALCVRSLRKPLGEI